MPRNSMCALCVLLLAAVPSGAARAGEVRPHAIGMIVQANRAQLGSGAATAGATIYEGDMLATDAQGALRLRAGNALVYLNAQSSAAVHIVAGGLQTELLSGTIVFSSSQASAIALLANGGEIRPVANGPAVAQVSLVGSQELIVVARRGAMQFTYGGESEVIPEGASYRVLLDPSDEALGGDQETVNPPSQQGPQQPPLGPPKKPKRRRKAFIFLLLGGAGIATLWLIHNGTVSPDAP